MPSSFTALGLSFCVLSVAACTAGTGEMVDASPKAGSGTLAIVQLERWAEVDDVSSHLLSDAKVATYRGVDGRGVERLLGGHGLESESCGLLGGLPQDLAHGELELLDVGEIDVQAGEQSFLLHPRVFPAVAGAAHGVFYAADRQSPQPRAEQDEYVVSAPGHAGLGAFDVALPAPTAVEDLVIDGAAVGPGAGLDMTRGRALDVFWAAIDPRDRVEFEWAAGGQVLTCVARDDGHFVVPAALLAALPADDAAQLTVRRVRLTRFDMQAVELAYVRAVSTVLHPLSLR